MLELKVKIVSKRDTGELKKILEENNITPADSATEKNADIIIAYGGDGTLFHALSFEKPILPIRGEGSLGFNADISLEDLREAVKNLKDYKVEKKDMIDIVREGKIAGSGCNDIIVVGANHRSIKFNVFCNGKLLLEKVIGDGVIVSTALGSTAYNFSAGGTIIEKGIVLTLNNPHSHERKSYAFNLEDNIEVEVFGRADVVIDGKVEEKIEIEKEKVLIRKSEKVLELVKIPGFIEGFEEKKKRLLI